MTAHAGMASHHLEEEKATHLIVPRSWSGRVYVIFAAIRAALPSNPTHNQLLNRPSHQKMWRSSPVREEGCCAIKVSNPVFESNGTSHSRLKDVQNCTLAGGPRFFASSLANRSRTEGPRPYVFCKAGYDAADSIGCARTGPPRCFRRQRESGPPSINRRIRALSVIGIKMQRLQAMGQEIFSHCVQKSVLTFLIGGTPCHWTRSLRRSPSLVVPAQRRYNAALLEALQRFSCHG